MTDIQVFEFNKVHMSIYKITRQIFVDEQKGIIVITTECNECHCDGDDKND